MKKKIIGIFVCTLLIATAIPAVGTLNKNIVQDLELRSNPQRVGFPSTFPDDVYFYLQWSLHNIGQSGGTPDSDIDAPEAWDIETGDPDVVIAIIDSGVDYTHPDLDDKIWVNEDEIPGNGIDDDGNGYIDDVRGWNFYDNDNDPMDDHWHGTWCAGIAAAETDNGEGIAGVCWDCQIMPLKKSVNMEFNLNEIIEAIEYAADNGADIISMSLGTYDYYGSLNDAVDYAYEKGVFMCASAGNDNGSMERYPAAFENVTAVAGTNHDDKRMEYFPWNIYSNYGDWVDVAAPGQQIYSTAPFEPYYGYASGCSAAVPHVAGLAALLLSKYPSLTPDEVKALICDHVDPYNSTYDLGSGRINAYKALAAGPPDLYCMGSLSWTDVKPGSTVTDTFKVKNIANPGSLLDWEVTEWPEWGTWTFMPLSGDDLRPEDGDFLVEVEIVAPNEENADFEGEVKVVNVGNPDDFELIDVSLATPRNKAFNFNFPLLSWLFERFPNMFPILRHVIEI